MNPILLPSHDARLRAELVDECSKVLRLEEEAEKTCAECDHL
jgi:hypothetical protein